MRSSAPRLTSTGGPRALQGALRLLRTTSALRPALVVLLVALAGCKDEDTQLPFTIVTTPTEAVTEPSPIFFTVTHRTGQLIAVSVEVSANGGRDFEIATAAPGSPDPQQLIGAPQGADQHFFWDPFADLGPGLHRTVRIRLFPSGDGAIPDTTGSFIVDLTDRLDPVEGNPPAFAEAIVLPLPDGGAWVTGGRNAAGGLNSAGYRYDPALNRTTSTPALSVARTAAAGVVLPSGRALILGGDDGNGPSAEVDQLTLDANGGASVVRLLSGLSVPRSGAAAAALSDGRALVLGGSAAGGPTSSIEVVTPDVGSQVVLSSPLAARVAGTATALLDGRVLLAGGVDGSGQVVPELAVVDAGVAAVTTAGSLAQGRVEHGAVLLPDGRVFIVGGTSTAGSDAAALATAEIFDPVTLLTTSVASMSVPRRRAGVAYTDGAVVVFGGSGDPTSPTSAERYELETGRWEAIREPSGLVRSDAAATTVGPGFVLVVGAGLGPERYYPEADLDADGSDLIPDVPVARADHTATRLFDGRVLLAGGTAGITSALDTVELFTIGEMEFTSAAPLLNARTEHCAETTVDGRVLVVGGRNAQGLVDQAETYDPATNQWRPAGILSVPRTDCTATRTVRGEIFVSGGLGANGLPVREIEVWDPETETFAIEESLVDARSQHQTVEATERVIVGPGLGVTGPLASLEVIDRFRRERFNVQGGEVRAGATLTFADFVVLIVGGRDTSGVRSDLAFLDLRGATPEFLVAPKGLNVARARHEAVLRITESVLLVGGEGENGAVLDRLELFQYPFGRPEDGLAVLAPDPHANKARIGHTASLLGNGQVVIVGGRDERGLPIAGAELFR